MDVLNHDIFDSEIFDHAIYDCGEEVSAITGVGTPSEEANGTGILFQLEIRALRYPYRRKRKPIQIIGIGSFSEESNGQGTIEIKRDCEITDEDIESFILILMTQ